jgi:hypothetical protein
MNTTVDGTVTSDVRQAAEPPAGSSSVCNPFSSCDAAQFSACLAKDLTSAERSTLQAELQRLRCVEAHKSYSKHDTAVPDDQICTPVLMPCTPGLPTAYVSWN